ncbi:MAG: hypothetical protein JSR58_04465 [Verrucomicrobia bacterium]|nr:hypothetical protein [Verrucomicrobiota bacterium]
MNQAHEEIEKKLIPRLKYTGYLLIVFGIIALGYHFFSEPAEERILTEEEMLTALEDPPLISMLMVATVFGAVGATCITISWRKRAQDIDR